MSDELFARVDSNYKPDPWGEYRAAATFTFDLDANELWRAAAALDPEFARLDYRGDYGPEVGVPRLVELFEKYDVNCTFFVPGKVAAEWPEAVKLLHEHGHEIAHHGYTHVSPREMSAEREATEFRRTIEVFEDLTGEPPVGYRTVGGMRDQTLDLVEDAGMLYDASWQDTDMPYLREDRDLVEIPNDYLLDDFVYWGFNMSPTFEFQSGISPHGPVFDTWEAEFDGIRERGRLFVLTMHPQIVGRASRVDALESLLQRMLSTGDTWVTTCAELARYWRDRYD
ncbi:polysaccharide deacetylase family protein [Haloferax gibbonsii]|uniref:Polysaccharide deacetylase n=1 Tax=Haloferax gibbonsii TaxID=35746 RepID=A0A0K1IXS1_HALGI|nr:polysaccharide deacetylase [Haloferax gibbonsii]AKU09239.1 polysaccharide deacetylase [Haloferax gibbonsii]